MISRSFAATLLAASLAVIAGGVHAQYGPPAGGGAPAPAPRAAPAAPAATAPAAATAPSAVAATSPVAIPPNTCVKPEYPGKLAAAQKFTQFNKDFNAYATCVQKYVDDTKLIVNAAAAAANGAVEDFNKFTADVKAQDEAAKN